MEQYKAKIADALADQAGLSREEIITLLEVPPDSQLGDFALPCFVLARRLKNAPGTIAVELANQAADNSLFERVSAAGPYVNFVINRALLARDVLGSILQTRGKYGDTKQGKGKVIVIDYSSPNIAKPFSVGHLRSTVIGAALARLYQSQGYEVVGINHLGDWGTQFGKLIAAYSKWGDERALNAGPIDHLFELYVRFHKEAEADPALEQEGRQWFKRLEDGDGAAVELWRRFRDLSLKEFERIYELLGVQFTHYQGESFYNDMLRQVIEEIKDKGLTRESEGALVVDVGDDMPPCMLKKQDGATLYATRDISAAIYRQQQYGFDKLLYLVAADQSLHFKQVFAVLEKMGYRWASRCEHIPFGLIKFKEGKMSTRHGKVILLEEVLNRAIELSLAIIEEKNPALKNKEEVANQVGIGAVLFGDLVNDRIKDVEFDWDRILDFAGDTAPYIQYAHARICSILRKQTCEYGQIRGDLYTADEEQTLIIGLARFPAVIKRALELNKPSVLARHLLDLARDFNHFYHACPVLQATGEMRQARLVLILAVRIVLARGLALLGIGAPDEM